MKFPLKVTVRGDSLYEGEISIAAINATVRQCTKHTPPSRVMVKLLNHPHKSKGRYKWADIFDVDGTTSLEEALKDEVTGRARKRVNSTINLGATSLQPCVCLRVQLQVTTKNGLPPEDPKAKPKFRVRVRFWDPSLPGKRRTATLWSDYKPDCDDIIVRINKKPTKIVFANHDAVLEAIRGLMPK